MNCPACRKPLETQDWKGTELDVCPACHGIWLDFRELATVATSADPETIDAAFEGFVFSLSPEEARQQVAGAERFCPRDKAPLTKHRWPGEHTVVMDTCARCGGTWLDAGELESIATDQQDAQTTEASWEQLTRAQVQQAEMNEEIANELEQMKARTRARIVNQILLGLWHLRYYS